MTRRSYLSPPWWMRAIGNRMARWFNPKLVSTLEVPGRVTGRPTTTSIVVLEHGGERYLLAPFGATDWALNLSAAGYGRLVRRGAAEEFTAIEVPPEERPPLIAAYRDRFDRMPKVADSFARLPDPADHPTFRIAPRVNRPEPSTGG
ncbi:PNPOx family protein [Flindersiella endophytica]